MAETTERLTTTNASEIGNTTVNVKTSVSKKSKKKVVLPLLGFLGIFLILAVIGAIFMKKRKAIAEKEIAAVEKIEVVDAETLKKFESNEQRARALYELVVKQKDVAGIKEMAFAANESAVHASLLVRESRGASLKLAENILTISEVLQEQTKASLRTKYLKKPTKEEFDKMCQTREKFNEASKSIAEYLHDKSKVETSQSTREAIAKDEKFVVQVQLNSEMFFTRMDGKFRKYGRSQGLDKLAPAKGLEKKVFNNTQAQHWFHVDVVPSYLDRCVMNGLHKASLWNLRSNVKVHRPLGMNTQ